MDTMILITGANGFVGRHMIYHLSQNEHNKIIAADIHGSLIPFKNSNPAIVEYISGDLSDSGIVNRLQNERHFDCIIHLAAIISQSADANTYLAIMNSNIQATFLLLEMAKEHKARLIFPSTALVYGNQKGPFREDMLPDPGDFYSLSKQMCEQIIRFYGNRYDVPSVIFRIGILYGPSQANKMFIPSLVGSLLSEADFPMTKGEQMRDFVYIDDLVDAVKIVLPRTDIAGTYNIGTGVAPMLKDVALKAEEITGVRNKLKLGALPYREKESWEYCLDSSKAHKDLHWQASTPITAGLARTIEYERSARAVHP
jgi:nucleoside-diphosphate-sugar epimerase